MKKFISLLIGCSLALAGAAMAQAPTDQSSPTTEKPAEKAHEGKGKREGKIKTKPETGAQGETGAMKEPGNATIEPGAGKRGGKGKAMEKSPAEPKMDTNVSGSATTEQGAGKHGRKGQMKTETSSSAETNVSGDATSTTTTAQGAGKHGRKGRGMEKSATDATPDTSVSGQATGTTTTEQAAGKHGRGKNARGATGETMPTATPVAAATATPAATMSTSTSATTSASVAPAVGANSQVNVNAQTNVGARGAVKVDKQKVEQVKMKVTEIKQQHINFKAQPRPDRVPPVQFNASFRIEGSDRWQGPQYEIYRSYHPERHDRGWYHQHYSRVELIGGGYYYWNNGYWAPAWGYDNSHEYYAYDAPIYVGKSALPPDRVIADVQAALQEMGYYTGEVDGLLGPLTREALTSYQADQGLTITQVIDEPTLDSLGMS
jgi:hypothetical protein